MASSIVHIEIPAADLKTTSEFYSRIFGWDVKVDERFNYWQFTGHGGPGGLGGAFVQLDENRKPGMVVVYIASDDIDATLAEVVAHGGTVAMPNTEVPDVGWMAIFIDPTGNMVGLWKEMHPDR